MKVILLNDNSLGKSGDIVNVKDGYATNFLIPQKRALFYNDKNYAYFKEKKDQIEVKNKEYQGSLNEISDFFLKKDLIIIANASDDGRLYGAVNSASISNEINSSLKRKIVSRSNIIITSPIKEIGSHLIEINISAYSIKLRVIVARTLSEAKSLAKNQDKKPNKSED